MSTEQHSDRKVKLSPVTYIAAALAAALTGYFAVYVNFMLSGNGANQASKVKTEETAGVKAPPATDKVAEKAAGSGPFGIAGLNKG
ncbi:MAG: hypothetical protein ACR2OX_04660, partial [Methyloligellaceae bacterium]